MLAFVSGNVLDMNYHVSLLNSCLACRMCWTGCKLTVRTH